MPPRPRHSCRAVGLFYGAYSSFKALNGDGRGGYDAVRGEMILRYWVVIAGLGLYESYAEWAVSFWLPFYSELKLAGLLWLLTPHSKAPKYFFDRLLHPTVLMIRYYVEERILPTVSSHAIRLVARAQPAAFGGLSRNLMKDELRSWDTSLKALNLSISIELERRRRAGDGSDGDLLANRMPDEVAGALLDQANAHSSIAASDGRGGDGEQQIQRQLLEQGTAGSPLAPSALRRLAQTFSSGAFQIRSAKIEVLDDDGNAVNDSGDGNSSPACRPAAGTGITGGGKRLSGGSSRALQRAASAPKARPQSSSASASSITSSSTNFASGGLGAGTGIAALQQRPRVAVGGGGSSGFARAGHATGSGTSSGSGLASIGSGGGGGGGLRSLDSVQEAASPADEDEHEYAYLLGEDSVNSPDRRKPGQDVPAIPKPFREAATATSALVLPVPVVPAAAAGAGSGSSSRGGSRRGSSAGSSLIGNSAASDDAPAPAAAGIGAGRVSIRRRKTASKRNDDDEVIHGGGADDVDDEGWLGVGDVRSHGAAAGSGGDDD